MPFLSNDEWTTAFTRIGKLAYAFNMIDTFQTQLTENVGDAIQPWGFLTKDVLEALETSTNEYLIGPDARTFLTGSARVGLDGYTIAADAVKQSLVASLTQVINGVCEAAGVPQNPEWFARLMVLDSQTVLDHAIDYDASTSFSDSKGYVLIFDDKYDEALGITNTEACVSDTILVQCLQTASMGATRGHESYTLIGSPARPSVYSGRPAGSGQSNTFPAALGASLLTDGSFENFTDDDPDSWTVNSGTTTEETGVVGDNCIGLVGTCDISQSVSLSTFTVYCAGLLYKKTGAGDTGTLTLTVADQAVSVDLSTISDTNWHLLSGTFVLDEDDYDADGYTCSITVTPSAKLYVDACAVTEPVEHAGLRWVVWPQAAPSKYDYVSTTLDNDPDTDGIVQKFFMRVTGQQLPSDSSPTISDALAE
jgi:hypothetical protein